jgi:RHS repeat-associated protein
VQCLRWLFFFLAFHYTFDGADTASGTYTVTLQDSIGRQSGVGFSVIRDTTPPTLTLEAVVQSDVLVAWNVKDSGSGVDASTCLLKVREDEGAWQTFSTECEGDDTYDGQPGHTYTFRLAVSDNVGNAASTEVEAVVPYVTKYYYANGQRVAMQREGVVYYVHTDHLGSTSVLSDESGQPAGDRVAYLPYGGVRLGNASTLPTDYTFTGQRNEAGIGLMHYGARFYSPRLGRFVSADSIVPQPGEPQALNRYSYVHNNPVIYTDPSGHYIFEDDPGRPYLGPSGGSIYDRGDILLENTGAIVPGDWDHANMIVSVDSEDSSRMWIVEAERAHGVWHHETDLSDNPNDWAILRVDTTPENRNAAAHWAEQLAGWDTSTDRQETSGAPFVSMIPFRDSPWGWFDIGAGKEGYYCFEVVVDAYQAQGVDITGRTQLLKDITQSPYYPEGRDFAVAGIALGNALNPNLGTEIYHSPNTHVIARREQR